MLQARQLIGPREEATTTILSGHDIKLTPNNLLISP